MVYKVMLLLLALTMLATCALAGEYDPTGAVLDGGYGLTLLKDTTPPDGIQTDEWENAGTLGIGMILRPEIGVDPDITLSPLGFTYRYLEGAFHGFGVIYNLGTGFGVEWFLGPELSVETTEGPTTVGGNVRFDGFFKFLSRPWYVDLTAGYMPGDRWLVAFRVNAVATAIK